MPFITRTFSQRVGGFIETVTEFLIGFDKDIPIYGERSAALVIVGSDEYVQQTLALCRAADPSDRINYFA